MLSEEREKSIKRIFIADGFEAGGWWRVMKSIFEIAEVLVVNPFKKLGDNVWIDPCFKPV